MASNCLKGLNILIDYYQNCLQVVVLVVVVDVVVLVEVLVVVLVAKKKDNLVCIRLLKHMLKIEKRI